MELENAHLLSHYCHCDRRTNTTDVNELVGDSFEVAHFGDLGAPWRLSGLVSSPFLLFYLFNIKCIECLSCLLFIWEQLEIGHFVNNRLFWPPILDHCCQWGINAAKVHENWNSPISHNLFVNSAPQLYLLKVQVVPFRRRNKPMSSVAKHFSPKINFDTQ